MLRYSTLLSGIVSVLLVGCDVDDRSAASGGMLDVDVEGNDPGGGGSSGASGTGGAAPNGSANGGTESTGPLGLEQGGMTGAGASGGGDGPAPGGADASTETPGVDAGDDAPTMSFFVTSRGSGSGGNFGGIAGADEFCRTLAAEASAALGQKEWRAYLSTSTQDARDRIGDGPWRNVNGVVIANNVAQLHDQGANGGLNATWPTNNATIALDEQGTQVPNQPVLHDILTGSNLDGTVSASGTCSDWTSQTGTTQNGHSNRAGGGQNPQSWSSSHQTGCGEPTAGQNFQQGTVSQGGGRGSIYCFALD